MEKSNAERFITAYNSIDYSLRTIYDFKRSMAFNDVVRRAVVLNSVVRKYEEDLIDFGRLRNAIVHQGNSKYILAEPHDDVVEKIEKLATLIVKPPLAINVAGNREVLCIDANITIAEAMELIYRTDYSNLPTYEGEKMIGVLNASKLTYILGKKIGEGFNLQKFIAENSVKDIINEIQAENYYILADTHLTVEQAMNYFESNRKLLIILVTKDGKETGKPLHIISTADVIDLKKVLDVY